MRYYLLVVQYNKDAKAENRTTPKGFDTLYDAEKAYHKQLADDMGNATLGWGICMVVDNSCNTIDGLKKRWDRETVEAPTVTE